MEILKIATEWAKAEVFSTRFFIIFGFLFIIASFGFWQLGKTEIAKAYIIPTLVAGVLLLVIGFGLVYTNKARIAEFEMAYQADPQEFINTEVKRVDNTLREYRIIVFKVIPLMIIASALLIIFVSAPSWRAVCITMIAMLIVILLIDGTAHGRIANYGQQLEMAKNK